MVVDAQSDQTVGSPIKRIATHDGTFHCDEVLAVHMLKRTQRFANSTVVRSRDPEELGKADIVVDVGAEYDLESMRFDHHQRGFSDTFASEGKRSRTKLSSAGLVYKHFGQEVIKNILQSREIKYSEDDLECIYLKVYDSFVEAVDGVDNGISQFDTSNPPNYESSSDLSSRVGRLNAAWNEPCTADVQNANFVKALAMVGAEFDDCVAQIVKSWLPARAIVAAAMRKRFEDEINGRILVMREWAPWKDHLFTLEEEEAASGKSTPVQLVVYEDMTGRSWRVQSVPVRKGSFESRCPLPDVWRGLRDDALSKQSGIPGCIFAHASGFIGGNATYDGAIAMATATLKHGMVTADAS